MEHPQLEHLNTFLAKLVQRKLKKPHSKKRSAGSALNDFETTASSDEDLILASRQFEQASTSVPTSRSAPALVLEDDDDDDISLLDIGVLRQPRRRRTRRLFPCTIGTAGMS